MKLKAGDTINNKVQVTGKNKEIIVKTLVAFLRQEGYCVIPNDMNKNS